MTTATSIQKSVRKLINSRLGSTFSLYSFSDATVISNDYGDDTSIVWASASASALKFVGSNHVSYGRLMGLMGLENNKEQRAILIADDVSPVPAAKDKIVIGTEAYEVIKIEVSDQIQDSVLAYNIILGVNEGYTV